MQNLTKRNLISKKCYCYFRNDATDEIIFEEITKETYKNMGGVDGYKFNPQKEGYTTLYAHEDVPCVDTESGFLGVNEYCDYDDNLYFLSIKRPNGGVARMAIEKQYIVDDVLTKDLWQ